MTHTNFDDLDPGDTISVEEYLIALGSTNTDNITAGAIYDVQDYEILVNGESVSPKRKSKFNNERCESDDGKKFDSKMELNHYYKLRLAYRAGTIQDLKCHPRYTLQLPFEIGDKKIRAIVYEADFFYIRDGVEYVVDVKGHETSVFKLKMKLFLKQYGRKVVFQLVRVNGEIEEWYHQ